MKNGFVNINTPIKEINQKIKFIEKNSIPTVFKKDVLQSKKQSKEDKVVAINRHISNVGYNERFKS